MTLGGKIKHIFNTQKDIYLFKSDSDQDKVVSQIAKRFDMIGDQVVNKTNGTPIDYAVFEDIVFNISNPFLRVQGSGRYIPKYADTRSSETKAKHAQDVGKVLDFFFDKLGYVFLGQHIGELALKEIVKNRIASDFLYEGTGEDGKMVFRKYHQGMISNPFDPVQVIEHYAGPYLDRTRTNERKYELRSEAEAELLKARNITKDKAGKQFNEDVERHLQSKVVAFSRKALPAPDSLGYLDEFERRMNFKLGIANSAAATLDQKRRIDAYKQSKIDELNSLPNIATDALEEIRVHTQRRDEWGITTENTAGYAMQAELL